jgi:hypothetical protein
VSLRRRAEDPRMLGVVALLDRGRTLGRPWVVAELGAHGCGLLGSTSSTTALLWRATIPALLALAFSLAAATTLVATTGAAAVADGVAIVATEGGPSVVGVTPAWTGAARDSRSEEGSVDDGLLIVGP